MSVLSSLKNISGYKTISLAIENLVPASIYQKIPDEEKLTADILADKNIYPLIVFDTTEQYWTKNHLPLYRHGNPDLPAIPPIVNGRVYVVWFGRQRLQICKKLNFVSVDCVLEKNFNKMLELGHKNKL
jgi:hypothetical protein